MVTLTGTRAATAFPVPGLPIPANCPGIAWGYYNVATAPSAADVINICKLPANSTVILGFIQAADLDTNATETLDIDVGWLGNGTDAADPDGFGNFGVLTGDAVAEFRPVAGIFLPFTNIIQDSGYKTFAAETTVTITFTGAPATLTAGYIKVVIFYV
ncbi:MAG TPA: hypothetical protein VFS91_04200 [Nitrobacter sp.]|nr:hypothetical protein [Nitrobacter sp.]